MKPIHKMRQIQIEKICHCQVSTLSYMSLPSVHTFIYVTAKCPHFHICHCQLSTLSYMSLPIVHTFIYAYCIQCIIKYINQIINIVYLHPSTTCKEWQKYSIMKRKFKLWQAFKHALIFLIFLFFFDSSPNIPYESFKILKKP